MVRLAGGGVLVWLLLGMDVLARPQTPPAAPAQSDQYFSGDVTRLEADRITVTRTVLGKEDATRTFLLTAETRTEGKVKVKARVTVRFVAGEDGDRAIHILVRPAKK